jgi:type II restriction enzyme
VDLSFDMSLAAGYKSPAQQARVLTEAWVGSQIFCPSCGRDSLNRYRNNTPVGDFFCSSCREQFELKATRNAFGARIVDGEYHTMIRRLQSNEVPNLFGLSYDRAQGRVRDLFVIPSQFFVPEIIECRKPLAPTARRARWIGCNILIQKVPLSGRISIVSDGVALAKPDVLNAWRRTLFLREQPKLEKRSWVLDVMNCIERIGNSELQLSDVYQYETTLARLHPENRHIRAKIRQQLQVLRDAGFIEFVGHGRYKMR